MAVLFCWAALRRFDKRLAADAAAESPCRNSPRIGNGRRRKSNRPRRRSSPSLSLTRWAKQKGTIKKRAAALAAAIFADDAAKQALGVNEYQGVVYFGKEAFERMLWDLFAVAAIGLTADPAAEPAMGDRRRIVSAFGVVGKAPAAAQESGYRVAALLKSLA